MFTTDPQVRSAPRVDISSATRASQAVLLGVALGFVALFVATALVRLQSPFPLNGTELGILHTVRRALKHEPLYPAPSPGFVPYLYPPLYYYVSAAAARAFGVGYPALRAVSCASILVSLALIGQIVRRETGSVRSGVLAAGLFAAIYSASGASFDVARVDSLFVALLLGTFYVLRFSSGLPRVAIGGTLMVLACFAKQTAFVVAIPAIVWLWAVNRREGAAFAAVLIAGVVAGTLLFVAVDGTWFPFYVFQVALHQNKGGSFGVARLWAHQAFELASRHLLSTIPVALVFASTLLVRRIRELSRLTDRAGGFYAAAASGTLGGALGSSLIQGSYVNAVLPVHAVAAILFGIAAHALPQLAERERDVGAALLVDALCIIQFATLAYVPSRLVPTSPEFAYRLLLVSRGTAALAVHEILEWSDASELEYANATAVNDLVAAAPPGVSRAFQEALAAEICKSTPARAAIVDAMLFDPSWREVVRAEHPEGETPEVLPLEALLARCPAATP